MWALLFMLEIYNLYYTIYPTYSPEDILTITRYTFQEPPYLPPAEIENIFSCPLPLNKSVYLSCPYFTTAIELDTVHWPNFSITFSTYRTPHPLTPSRLWSLRRHRLDSSSGSSCSHEGPYNSPGGAPHTLPLPPILWQPPLGSQPVWDSLSMSIWSLLLTTKSRPLKLLL